MAYAIKHIPSQSIIIVTIDLPLEHHLQQLQTLNAEILHLADQLPTPLYLIWDLRSNTPCFSDILIWLDDYQSHATQPIDDPRIQPIVAGTHPMVSIGLKKVQQHAGIQVPHYETLEEALAFAHARTAQDNSVEINH